MNSGVKKNPSRRTVDGNNSYASLQKAFRIVELLAARAPLGVTEIGRELTLEKSSVSRLLKSLCSLGYALQDVQRGKYTLSPRILELAHRYQSGNRLVQAAQPVLRELAAAARASAHLGLLVERDLIIAAKEASPEVIQVTSRRGGRMPLHASALGKVILAEQEDEEACGRLLELPLTRYTQHTITDIETLRKNLRDVRRKGYALEMQEEHLGVGCIAAPVRDAAGRCIGAISAAGPIRGTPFKLDARHCQLVVEEAEELSRHIGAPSREDTP